MFLSFKITEWDVKVYLFFFAQIEGAFIQGVGLYTLEEIYFSPEGEQLTLGPDTYKIPAICDIPEQFRVYLLPNSRNSIAIYSSKVNTPSLPFASTPGDSAAKL